MAPPAERATPHACVEVLILTQQSCDLCERARELLDRLSEEYPLQVRSVALDSPEGRGLAAAGGVLFAPGIFVDGDAFSYGRLSERKLRRELNRRLAPA